VWTGTRTTPASGDRGGGVVEIVFLAVFQRISVFAVCTRMCTIDIVLLIRTL
jgi:hypothetical protein